MKYLVELGELSSPVQPARIDNNNFVVTRDKVELGQQSSPVQPARIDNNSAVTGDKVELGANIHALNEYAVRRASKNGYLEVVKYLVSAGADIHAENEYALRHASVNGYSEVVEYISDRTL